MAIQKKDKNKPPSLIRLLANKNGYSPSLNPERGKKEEISSESIHFEDTSCSTSAMKPYRWKLGSEIGSVPLSQQSSQNYNKLKTIHKRLTSIANHMDSKTLQRNLHFASLLQQWFPESLIDQAISELHSTDPSKVMTDEKAVGRILGYIEALLRASCRTIPWKTIEEINRGLGYRISKNMVAAAKFRAVQCGAFKDFYQNRDSSETFDVVRFQIVSLITKLDIDACKKRQILELSQRLCKALEKKRQIPKDPEIYGMAIVELSCKKILKKRWLMTCQGEGEKLKKKVSTAMHYIKKQLIKSN